MEKHFQVPKTARYFLNAEPKNQHTIWLVFHGYGQLSKYFIQKFEFLDPEENLIVAPEGLHRFYLEGFRGRVGASWMTKEDRLHDISDSNSMLDVLLSEIQGQFENQPKLRIIAFSQGVATASRWVLNSNVQTSQMILWGGVFPPDFDCDAHGQKLVDLDLKVVVGVDDEFYQNERQQALHEALDQGEIPYELHVVTGKHDIDRVAWEALKFV